MPRPPWALAEIAFVEHCTRCGDCARACPTAIIRQGDGGYPVLDFARGECTFCGDCADACSPRAIARKLDAAPWQLRASIVDTCLAQRQIECRICGEQCAEQAIGFPPQAGGIARPVLDASRCTGCGACIAPCPVAAIRIAPR